MSIIGNYIKLRERSLDTNDNVSAKRLVTITSHDLFVLQIIIDILLNIYLTVFKEPKVDIQHYQLMISVQLTGLFCNLLIVLWGLGAIKNVDIAFANIVKQKEEKENLELEDSQNNIEDTPPIQTNAIDDNPQI